MNRRGLPPRQARVQLVAVARAGGVGGVERRAAAGAADAAVRHLHSRDDFRVNRRIT